MTGNIITLAEAAERLEVCARTVARGVRQGVLRAKYGGLKKDRIVGAYADSVEALRLKGTADGDGYQTRDIRPAAR